MSAQHAEYQRGYRDGARDRVGGVLHELWVAPRVYREGYEDGYYGARPALPLTADCAREAGVADVSRVSRDLSRGSRSPIRPIRASGVR